MMATKTLWNVIIKKWLGGQSTQMLGPNQRRKGFVVSCDFLVAGSSFTVSPDKTVNLGQGPLNMTAPAAGSSGQWILEVFDDRYGDMVRGEWFVEPFADMTVCVLEITYADSADVYCEDSDAE